MRRLLILLFALTGLTVPAEDTNLLSRIAFGAGLNTDKPQPIWSAVRDSEPQQFILLSVTGTNAFGGTNIPMWRAQGREARVFGPPGKQVQVIVLDTMARREPPSFGALLGPEQWTWFREQLRQPAQLRVVASSLPVLSEDHRGEKWADWPHERTMLFDMISDTEAEGVLFVSGDGDHAELSAISDRAPYPLYDLTAGPMNRETGEPIAEINRYGISDVVRDNNFGLITIDWSAPNPTVALEIRDEQNRTRTQHTISLSALQTGAEQGPQPPPPLEVVTGPAFTPRRAK